MRFYGGAKNDIVTKNVDIFSSDLLQVGGGKISNQSTRLNLKILNVKNVDF